MQVVAQPTVNKTPEIRLNEKEQYHSVQNTTKYNIDSKNTCKSNKSHKY